VNGQEQCEAAGRVWRLADARAVERHLRGLVSADAERCRSAPERLARPARIVVPSSSLRQHVAASLLAAPAAARLGVRVQTLSSLAHEILAAHGQRPGGGPLLPIQVERLARREPALAESLEGLDAGYASVGAVVDDLLDAGYLPVHAEALAERIQEAGAQADAPRARALVRVTSGLRQGIESGEVAHRSFVFERARDLVERNADAAVPAREVWIVGFSDATAVQADLLESLVRHAGAHVLFERPEDPCGAGDAGEAFGERLRERLDAAGGRAADPGAASPRSRVRALCAPDREAEVREVARRVRAAIDDGVAPERIAIVARDLGTHRIGLRRQLRRHAIPFSGLADEGPVTSAGRRLRALLSLLEAGERASVEAWLAGVWRLPGAPGALSVRARARLRRGLHARGTVQLRDAARLSRADFEGAERERLGAVGQAASGLGTRLAAWPARAPLGDHLARLERLARGDLGWTRTAPGSPELEALCESLGPESARHVEVTRSELLGLLAPAIARAGRARIGGGGGGVALLTVMEARGRTFDRLFVVGMNRGIFPRNVSEDPLLPDALRRELRDVLPDLPVKREGHDEERALFARLLAAAPEVELTHAELDDEGRPTPASPLLESALACGRIFEVAQAPPLHAHAHDDAIARPAFEHALLSGLHGGRGALAPVLGVALERVRESLAASSSSVPPSDAWAAARHAVVGELDDYGGAEGRLGPYFGFVGRRTGDDDRRRAAPYITLVEAMARCPWQAHLGRVLKLKPTVDAISALPHMTEDRLLLGNVVHGALERIVACGLPEGAPAGLDGPATRVAWPSDAQVEESLHDAAVAELAGAGVAIPGYAALLAGRARPYVEVARGLDFAAGAVPVVGVELHGEVVLRDAAGRDRALQFRADRVDRIDGHLRISDYKTGRVEHAQADPAKREASLESAVAAGGALQAVAYAAAGLAAVGRYVYLKPDGPEVPRVVEVESGSAPAQAAAAPLEVALDAYESGVFVPKLRRVDLDQESSACRTCEVKEACLRGDSSARGRLSRFLERVDAQGSRLERSAAALLALGGAS
jgi:hypothetical protein